MQIKLGNTENQVSNISLQAQEKTGENNGKKAAKQQRKNTIFAGDLPLYKDSIALRRQQAQKKAMKFVQDAWNVDRKTDQGIAEYRELAEEQRKELQVNQDKVAECEARKEDLRESYGVEADSQEQKDLELLERAYYPTMDDGELTEEEQQRVAELKGQPLTEYQQKCLEIDGEKRVFESRAQSAESRIMGYNGAVRSMKIERLKFHKMTDAQNNAKEIMEQASEDIQGMLVDEAKDHVDETYEEQREEAKEKAEEKEEQEEKVEKVKEQKEQLEERIDSIQEERNEAEANQKEQEREAREEAELLHDMADAGLNVAGASDAVKAEIKDMLNKMKLIEADIKGIEVDEGL